MELLLGGSDDLNTLPFQNILEDVMALDAVLFHTFPVVTPETVPIVYRINVLDIRVLHPKQSCLAHDCPDRHELLVDAVVVQNQLLLLKAL